MGMIEPIREPKRARMARFLAGSWRKGKTQWALVPGLEPGSPSRERDGVPRGEGTRDP
jgi:hypothetical protein